VSTITQKFKSRKREGKEFTPKEKRPRARGRSYPFLGHGGGKSRKKEKKFPELDRNELLYGGKRGATPCRGMMRKKKGGTRSQEYRTSKKKKGHVPKKKREYLRTLMAGRKTPMADNSSGTFRLGGNLHRPETNFLRGKGYSRGRGENTIILPFKISESGGVERWHGGGKTSRAPGPRRN